MIDMRVRQLFFDSPKVLRAVGKAKRRVLTRAGAWIRQVARRSIRRRKGTSAPGKPPHSHEGSLRRLLFFGYDRKSESVVIGPVGFKRSPAPQALEHGGVSRIHRRRKGRLVKAKARIAKRPYMGPALAKERPQLPSTLHKIRLITSGRVEILR